MTQSWGVGQYFVIEFFFICFYFHEELVSSQVQDWRQFWFSVFLNLEKKIIEEKIRLTRKLATDRLHIKLIFLLFPLLDGLVDYLSRHKLQLMIQKRLVAMHVFNHTHYSFFAWEKR